MTSLSRRKHRITAQNLRAKTQVNRRRWRAYLIEAGRAGLAVLLGTVVASNMAPVAIADELGRPPATFNISDDAIPIEEANAENVKPSSISAPKHSSAQWSSEPANEESTAWKLRWRRPTGLSPVSVSDSKPMTASRAVVWNKIDSKSSWGTSSVRQVSQVTPVDPFEEPYPAQPRPVPTTTAEQNVQPDVNRPDARQPNASQLPRPMPNSLIPVPDDAPTPPGTTEPMRDTDQAPVPPQNFGAPDSLFAPIPEDMPCDRTYNFRNCCTDDAKCRQARGKFSQYKITNISLDITPSFTNTESPTSQTFVPTEVRKQEELAKAPSRTWKNRAGETLAEGRLADYRNGAVRVEGEDGQTKDLLFNDLSDDDLCFVTAWWSLPTECSLADEQFQNRKWLPSTLTWKASALCHKPLYFEEVALERYGHSVGPIKQPFVSGAHFFGSFLMLPYQMGMHPPQECQYALGYYRPGSCAPWLVPPVPFSLRGALAEAGVLVGGIYIFP